MDSAFAGTYAPAARAALAAFPIDPEGLEPVSMAENVTFRVTDRRDGTPYALRLHRPWYHTLESLLSERLWIRALDAAGIAVQTPLRTRDGEEYTSVVVPATGERRLVGMARWREGRLMSELVHDGADPRFVERCFEQLGALVAAMHAQSSRWQAPAGFSRPALDADGFMGEEPRWGPFWRHPALTPDERELVLDTRRRLKAVLEKLSRAPEVYSVIHADMHPGNILVDGGTLSVIDFDDAAWGWHAYDIAVVLVYHQYGPHFASHERAFLAGYRAVRPLPDEVVALLPTFRLVRGLAQIGWHHQRPELGRLERFDAVKARTLEQCVVIGRSL
jgi:Ser/Thr protein kinase RdoA (MazF antagonist)